MNDSLLIFQINYTIIFSQSFTLYVSFLLTSHWFCIFTAICCKSYSITGCIYTNRRYLCHNRCGLWYHSSL